MKTQTQHNLFKFEQSMLLFFVAMLPAFEAPKNIAIALYFIAWLINRSMAHDWGGKWSHFDSLFSAIILASIASAIFGAFPPDKGIQAVGDVITYSCLFLAVRRSAYSDKMIYKTLSLLILSTIVTLMYGYWELFVTHTEGVLKLNSVGHVNHGAIYIAIVFCLALSWSLAKDRYYHTLWACGIVLWISLFMTDARGAIIPSVFFVALFFLYKTNRLYDLWKPVVSLIAIVAVTIVVLPGAINKISSENLGSKRPDLARVSIIAAQEHPLFGVGITNFAKITPNRISEWQEKNGPLFKADTLFFSSHAHNVYFNTLGERGILGLSVLMILLLYLIFNLIKSRPSKNSPSIDHTVWGGALGAWVIVSIGGLFNTTLHHEHGALSLLLMALWFSKVNTQLTTGQTCTPLKE
jgi:O-antigen ligase